MQLKGRVAAEINSIDSLLVTEIIFENLLNALQPEDAAALLSCLVFRSKVEGKVDIPEHLQESIGKDTSEKRKLDFQTLETTDSKRCTTSKKFEKKIVGKRGHPSAPIPPLKLALS